MALFNPTCCDSVTEGFDLADSNLFLRSTNFSNNYTIQLTQLISLNDKSTQDYIINSKLDNKQTANDLVMHIGSRIIEVK